MMPNATFNNFSVISWWSVLLVEETVMLRAPFEVHMTLTDLGYPSLPIFLVITLEFHELKSYFSYLFFLFEINFVFICVYLWYICNMNIFYHLPFK